MPELPEVEVVRRGLAPHIEQNKIISIVVRDHRLRWPVPPDLGLILHSQVVQSIRRRGKYLLFQFHHGHLILHLGMSGVLRWLPLSTPPIKHDHIDICFSDGLLRLNDPRRFGAALWHPAQGGAIENHPLLVGLGVEPLLTGFDGEVLYRSSRNRSLAIKQFLLAGDVVVGVGNIYASEALFDAGIHPARQAGRVGRTRYDRLAQSIRTVLASAIEQGGSTLRDFRDTQGASGYFQVSHRVYDREGAQCARCGPSDLATYVATEKASDTSIFQNTHRIKMIRQGQRSTFFCARCQT